MDPSNETVVLVEDNPDEVDIALHALRRHGIEGDVKVLRDGQEAIDWLRALEAAEESGRRARPAAIFLDLRLPHVEGMKVLSELRESPTTRQVPVVVVSSTQQDSEIAECYRLGANSFISKQYGGERPGEYFAQAVLYWTNLNRVARWKDEA